MNKIDLTILSRTYSVIYNNIEYLAHTYACALWRSPRMEKLRKLLMELEI